jgi:hypothetical protein
VRSPPERSQDQASEGANRLGRPKESRVRGNAAECSGILVMNFTTEQPAAPGIDLGWSDPIPQVSRRTVEQGLVSVAAAK